MTESQSYARAIREIKRRANQAEYFAAQSEKYPIYRDQQRAMRDAYIDALDILSTHMDKQAEAQVTAACGRCGGVGVLTRIRRCGSDSESVEVQCPVCAVTESDTDKESKDKAE